MRRRPWDRGFTLVELGIVIAVISVLSIVLISARYFIDSAKIGSAVQMVNSIRESSRAYSKRVCGGIGFSCAGSPAIAINQLQAQNLLPPAICSPWCTACNPPAICGVGVTAIAPANTNLRVGICVPSEAATRSDIRAALTQIGAVGNGGPCAACPPNTACMRVDTR